MDALISIGSTAIDQEHMEIILEGLSTEYDAFSTVIRTRKQPYTVCEIESLLLAQETRSDLTKTTTEIPSVNLTNFPKDKNVNTENTFYQGNTRGNQQNFRGGRRGFSRNRGRGRFYSNYQGGRLVVTCQVCYKFGHSAAEFYHRFDHNYQPPVPQYTHQPSTRGNSNNNMAAFMAYSNHTYENGWFPDSGATNHVTVKSSNIFQGIEHTGSEQLYVGNGAGLCIKKIRTSFVNSSVKPFISLALNDFLLVPNITKNLLSVSKFAKDNMSFLSSTLTTAV